MMRILTILCCLIGSIGNAYTIPCHTYLKYGMGMPIQKEGEKFISMNLGFGKRTQTDPHVLDMSSTFYINPLYLAVVSEVSYLFISDALKGFYAGAGVRLSQYFCEVHNFYNSPHDLIIWSDLVKINQLSAPFTIGYGKEVNGRYEFLEFKITHHPYVTLSSGIYF